MRRTSWTILFSLLAAAAVVGRFALYFTAVDPATGFYTAAGRLPGLIFSVAAVVILIGCALVHRFSAPEPVGRVERSAGFGVMSLLLAAVWVAGAIMDLLADGVVLRTVTVGVLALCSAAYLVLSGVDALRGTRLTPAWLVAVLPLWAGIKLVLYYTTFHGVIYLSEGIIEVFAMALSMLFWLYAARVTANVGAERAGQWALGFGIPAVAACLMATLPRLAAGLMGRTDLTAHGAAVDWTLLGTAIYAVAFLILSRRDAEDEEDGLSADEEPEESAAKPAEETFDPPTALETEPAAALETEPVAVPEPADSAPAEADEQTARIDRMVQELLEEKETDGE